MRHYRAVLFDLDGLMVDTEPYHFRAFQTLLQRRGVSLPESIMEQQIGTSEVSNLRDLIEMYRLSEDLDALLRERRQIYVQTISREPVRAMEGFWELSEEVRRLGLQQAVVSSSLGEYVRVTLERLFASRPEGVEYGRYFDAVICGDDAPQPKPAPDLYLLAARKLAREPGECLALEDSPAGLQAAVAADMHCLVVPSGYARSEDFSCARATLNSLSEALPYLQNHA